MYLLLEQLRDMFKAEAARTFEQDDLVAQLLEDRAGEEILRSGEKVFFGYEESAGVRRKLLADADELVDATLHAEVVHLSVKFLRLLTTLVDVAQYQRPLDSRLLATVHEVESDVQRIDVGIVGVVDERTAVLSLLHLKAHGNRLQEGHPLCQLAGRESQVQRSDRTDDAVLDTGFVDEGDGVLPGRTFIYIGDMGPTPYPSQREWSLTTLNCCHKEGNLLVGARPSYLLALIVHSADATAHGIVVGWINHGRRVVHQFQLLQALLLHGAEILLMGIGQASQDTDGGLYDVVQGHHLARLADACLEDAHLGLLVQQPYRERHANLRIVRTRRAHNLLRRQQELIKPLLDHRLAVGPGDTHDGNVELVTMTFGQTLQGCQRRRHFQVVGILLRMLRHLFHHERADTTTIELADVVVAVVALRAQGEEQCLLGKTE